MDDKLRLLLTTIAKLIRQIEGVALLDDHHEISVEWAKSVRLLIEEYHLTGQAALDLLSCLKTMLAHQREAGFSVQPKEVSQKTFTDIEDIFRD